MRMLSNQEMDDAIAAQCIALFAMEEGLSTFDYINKNEEVAEEKLALYEKMERGYQVLLDFSCVIGEETVVNRPFVMPNTYLVQEEVDGHIEWRSVSFYPLDSRGTDHDRGLST